jgi:hypothetical protein
MLALLILLDFFAALGLLIVGGVKSRFGVAFTWILVAVAAFVVCFLIANSMPVITEDWPITRKSDGAIMTVLVGALISAVALAVGYIKVLKLPKS